uniref:Uncharacterized protein n=1 Tax=Globisporangium ultimum (strain ATCC 200006 / CBS 805.95 / DAOM BR144) TaxID=431595 RepID=K3WX87_GLOUD
MLKQPPGGELPPSPPDPGVASPLNFKEAVRDKSSDKHGDDEFDEWVKRLTKIAERPWKVKDDENLRPMVPAEEEALAAWAMDSAAQMEATFFEASGVELDEILKSTKELKQQAGMTATWWDNVKE